MRKKSETNLPPAPHDPWRAKILDALKSKGINLKEASGAIEKGHAYMQQFIMRGTPQALDEADILILSSKYDIDADLLRSEKQKSALLKVRKHIKNQQSRRDMPTLVKDKTFALTMEIVEKQGVSPRQGWELLEVLEDVANDQYSKKGSISLDEDEAERYLRFAVLHKNPDNDDNNK